MHPAEYPAWTKDMVKITRKHIELFRLHMIPIDKACLKTITLGLVKIDDYFFFKEHLMEGYQPYVKIQLPEHKGACRPEVDEDEQADVC